VIADAVLQATQEAVQSAVREVLANQQLLQALQTSQSVTPPPPQTPSFKSRVSKGIWSGVAWVGEQVGRVAGTVASVARKAVSCATCWLQPVVWTVLTAAYFALGVRRASSCFSII
jgi:hypothetical protein